MKDRISRIIRTIVPYPILSFIIPKKFPPKNSDKRYYNRFIDVYDTIAERSFKMFLREDSYMEAAFYASGLYGDWEKESLKIWAELSKRANTIIDVGSNTGIYSLVSRNNNSKALIIAVEPVDLNYQILKKNIRKNKYGIVSEKIALSDSEGKAKMFMQKGRINYMTSINENRYDLYPEISKDYEITEIEVAMHPFSYLVEKYGMKEISLVKIDVEGHEKNVVKSMFPYLEKFKPDILVEVIGEENALILDTTLKKVGYSNYICINEKNKSSLTNKLWDNDHHNFLICGSVKTIDHLRSKNLID